ncbi:MAG: restriction endonuclease subunit S [Planctomycetaceae bacterium]|jgi:hypothetical protein|nr:restriction endonuclease subunit S [Planctomycetaceae bacterium]
MIPLQQIFNISYGTNLELLNCEQDPNGIPFISRTSTNNGVVTRVCRFDNIEPMSENAITVALSGSVLSSFLQEEPFYTSFHIACLHPKKKLTSAEMIYYCSVIEKNKYRYNYGRQANRTLKNILVPEPECLPSFLKKYKTNLPFSKTPQLKQTVPLDPLNWQWFCYGDLFKIVKGKRLTKENMITVTVPFIGATEFNNGVTAYIDNDQFIHSGNKITVSYNGSVGRAFYQPTDFFACDDVNVLEPRFNLNRYIAIFITTLIEQEQYRFNYGRKWTKEKMELSKIKLPVTSNGVPDWEFMENYIKSLSYSGNL